MRGQGETLSVRSHGALASERQPSDVGGGERARKKILPRRGHKTKERESAAELPGRGGGTKKKRGAYSNPSNNWEKGKSRENVWTNRRNPEPSCIVEGIHAKPGGDGTGGGNGEKGIP